MLGVHSHIESVGFGAGHIPHDRLVGAAGRQRGRPTRAASHADTRRCTRVTPEGSGVYRAAGCLLPLSKPSVEVTCVCVWVLSLSPRRRRFLELCYAKWHVSAL